jgi:hypothetical protein
VTDQEHRSSLRRLRLAALVALVTLGLAAAPAAGATTHKTQKGLVGYPSFLPKDTLHVRSDALLVGTAARPALTSEGDAVKVVAPRWSARVIVRGPEVPGEGLPYQTRATTCTWTVTMSMATGPVPISAADFDSIDVRGDVYRPSLVPGRPAPPRVLLPGQKVTFELRAVEAVGEGLMRWAPIGGHIVAKWDFVVEND